MMKKLSRFLAVISAGVCVFCAAACDNGERGSDAGENNIELSVTYGTLKVMQDGAFENLGQKLSVFAAKNETESGQLIVKPERNVANLRLLVSDLTLKGDSSVKFPKENVTVYFQKYINVLTKTPGNENENYPTGYTPDMLLEQSIAVRNGENTAEAQKNQGITVEFKTTAETAAGEYEGKFILEADGKSYDVPVTFRVYDVTLSKINGQTCFCLNNEGMCGEYDTSSEEYRKYYENLMHEYKIVCNTVPSDYTPEDYAKNVDYYYDDPAFTGYGIDNKTCWIVTGKDENGNKIHSTKLRNGRMYSYFYALAKRCKPGRILLDKAYMYMISFDEVRAAQYDTLREALSKIKEIQREVVDDLQDEGFFDEYPEEFKNQLYEAITTIPLLVTNDMNQIASLGSSVNSYCGVIYSFATQAERKEFEAVREANQAEGGETWFYTCMNPQYPMPSHHIDDNLLSARVMRWMQKDYDWQGYLYWSVTYYGKGDPYETAARFGKYNGDGFLVYPGKKYGEETFLPSLRTLAVRDGQEDYDLLCLLEEILNEKAETYGAEVSDSHILLNEFYESLYSDVTCFDSDATYSEVRRSLLEQIEEYSGESGFYFEKTVEDLTATASFYTAASYELAVNGKKLSGTACENGLKYTWSAPLTEAVSAKAVISKDGKEIETHEIAISGKRGKVELGEENSPLYASESSEISYADGAAKIALRSYGETLSEIARNKPSVGILAAGMGGARLAELDEAEFDVTNNSSEEITITTRFKSKTSEYLLNSYKIGAGETRRIVVRKIFSYKNHWSALGGATLDICVDNAYVDSNGEYKKYRDREITLSNVYYLYKEATK